MKTTRKQGAENFVVLNPKQRNKSIPAHEKKYFPYYAGFSDEFTSSLLQSMTLTSDAIILDPWNGGGTTTTTGSVLGHQVIGIDINPVMVLVAKAGFLSSADLLSVFPLMNFMLRHLDAELESPAHSDPLTTWISPASARTLRALEKLVNAMLISDVDYIKLNSAKNLDLVSPLAAFFYVVLFRVARSFLVDFIPSNPTWVKKPLSSRHRKNPSKGAIETAFKEQVAMLAEQIGGLKRTDAKSRRDSVVRMGNSQGLLIPDNTVDVIVSSPPYCTRIDYAVSTAIELALLDFDNNAFDGLRRSMMGTATVGSFDERTEKDTLGGTCHEFLDRMYEHPSKASKTYYYKNHIQYFRSLNASIGELTRVLSPGGHCVLVAQDSYYKELPNDVPKMIAEMAKIYGLELMRQDRFSSARSMARLHPGNEKYGKRGEASESVLCFRKI